ncbi:hypothetical protein GCM10025784_31930 [Citricoccus nitrophenolicus]
MSRTRRTPFVGYLMGAILAVTLTACSFPGDLSILNEGPDGVTVLTGDDEVVLDTGGGVILLDYGCTPGDVTVEFDSGSEVVVPGPVCPEQQIVVGDGTAMLQPAESNEQ